ncbi:MAG: ABC transporter substrate-binding protein [archaeon]
MKKIAFALLSLIVFLVLFGCTSTSNDLSEIKKGPASDYLVFVPIQDDKAAELLLNGQIDMSLTPLAVEEANKLKDSNINIYTSPSQFFSLSLNPAPSNSEKINPFSSKKVRFALNNLIPKQKMVDDLFGGYGSPKDTPLFKESPDYALLKETLKKFDFSYKPGDANKVITEFMEESGATKVNNKWQFKEKPVEITYLIYAGTGYNDMIEVNDYLAGVLEETGFVVNKVYYDSVNPNPFSKSDAKDLNWNLISSGGIYFGASKYDDYAVIGEAPYQKSLMGSNEEGNWNYENEELDTIAKKLEKGDYNSEQEWEALFKQGMEITLDEAYSVYVITKEQIFAANKKVEGLTVSDFTAIRLLQNLREINIPGKNKLIIGTKETYNKEDPLSYSYLATNIYRMDIKMALMDFGAWSNPKTLEYDSLRWNYEIETAGPNGKLAVPEDAFIWKNEGWSLVGKDINATTKITFDLSNYLGTNWQNGEKITWADVLYSLQTGYESVYNKKWNEITQSQEMYLEKYKGYRIDGNKLEMYVDEWSFSNGKIADNAVFSVYPWVLFSAENTLVYEDRNFMYDSTSAKEYKVPAMRLVNENHIQKVLQKLDEMNYEDLKKAITVGDKVYSTEEEFNNNKAAIKKWVQERNNLIITDGPFSLYSFDENTGTVTLKAVRDNTYPFKKGDWLAKIKRS